MRILNYFLMALSVTMTGCDKIKDDILGDNPADRHNTSAVVPFEVLYNQGIDRYIGKYTPMTSDFKSDTYDVTEHSFAEGDGPLCMDGSHYKMATRDMGSENLAIYLQGGGACWVGSPLCEGMLTTKTAIIPDQVVAGGILDPELEVNPIKNYNVGFLPYCDGGLFASDKDIDSSGDGVIDRKQRGLHNLSAGLDAIKSQFKAPKRIVLMGSSAGGLGTTFAIPLVRKLWPDIPIDVINDSGIGVAKPDQPEFIEQLMNDWNGWAFVSEDCEDCIAEDGNFTDYHIWQMNQDKNLRRAMLSPAHDLVFADIFLRIGIDSWLPVLYREMKELDNAHPGRSAHYITGSMGHTFLLDLVDASGKTTQKLEDVNADGISLLSWIDTMLNDPDNWKSVAESYGD